MSSTNRIPPKAIDGLLATLAIGWLLMAAAVLIVTIPFSGGLTTPTLARIWLAISDSAHYLGTAVLVCSAGVLVAAHSSGSKRKLLLIELLTALTVGAILFGAAQVNEHWLKPAFNIPRPSLRTLRARGVVRLSSNDFYKLSREQRRLTLRASIGKHMQKVRDIHPAVLKHWTYEVGHSFPSGHSFNAFLVAGLLGFSLLRIPRASLWCSLLTGWAALVCISRVALGVHSPTDVVVGAAEAITLCAVLMWSPLLPSALNRVWSLANGTRQCSGDAERVG